uniref:Uncharacterized protein n=1 Tax=Candidatus Methanogaster sp. ANME-2c ERB4 TaxID=2759911 RepID=A0A7G9YJJ9_9EURY|nr:hypothetical protein GOJLPIDM_00040 [Methanosarcinales archaeon ANME-2c ERB4]
MWEWDNDYWEDSYRNEYRLSLLGLDFHQLASMNLSRHASVLCGFISQVLPKIYLHSVLQLIKKREIHNKRIAYVHERLGKDIREVLSAQADLLGCLTEHAWNLFRGDVTVVCTQKVQCRG